MPAPPFGLLGGALLGDHPQARQKQDQNLQRQLEAQQAEIQRQRRELELTQASALRGFHSELFLSHSVPCFCTCPPAWRACQTLSQRKPETKFNAPYRSCGGSGRTSDTEHEEWSRRVTDYGFNDGCTGEVDPSVPSKHDEVNEVITSKPDNLCARFADGKRDAQFQLAIEIL